MAIVSEIIRLENDYTLSFGNYLTVEKCKKSNFEVEGDIYKVKTHCEVTRLEKNEKLLFESVPGSSVHHFNVTERLASFYLEGVGDTRITIELLPDQKYEIFLDGEKAGQASSNFSGKISFSADLTSDPQEVLIESIN